MIARRAAAAVLLALALAVPALAQTPSPPPEPLPARVDSVRHLMGLPSRDDDFRGQRDTVGFAHRPDQMARTWELSVTPPRPDSLGPAPPPGVAGILAPHDDFLYAARVYRRVTPLVTARTVVLIGVFHGYRRFGVRDRLVFEPYKAWAAPDGPVPVSALRNEVLLRLADDDFVTDMAMHDAEHSLEPLVYWLRHQRPGLEIVPILVPAARFERLQALADHLGDALTGAMHVRGWTFGHDVAVVISSDAVHYGADFKHVPFGAGGRDALARASARDRGLLTGPLRGTLSDAGARALFETFVDPEDPDTYRVTWCGRFSVPFGTLLLERLAAARGQRAVGHPIAYATSMSAKPLPLAEVGLGATAPATLEHFVGYPAAAFTFEARAEPRRR